MRLSWTTESSSCLTVMTLVGLLSAATGLSLAGDGCEVGAGATGGARTHRPIRYHYQGVLMQRVIIAPHMKCNARCAHCCVSSHPKDERHLEDATVVRLIDEAIASPSIKIVAFTGGEALLRKSFILEQMRRLKRAGKRSTIVSNGFWGITEASARGVLLELADAGVRTITISADTFHLPYVPIERVRNILKVRDVAPEIEFAVNICQSRSEPASKTLDQLEGLLEGVHINSFDITPVGQAEGIASCEITYDHVSTENLKCPGQVLLFLGDGQVYPCCSLGVINSALSVGDANELTIEEGARRIECNLAFKIMTEEGLGWFVEKLKRNGDERFAEPFPVVDACHLCSVIFADKSRISELRNDFEEYKAEYVSER